MKNIVFKLINKKVSKTLALVTILGFSYYKNVLNINNLNSNNYKFNQNYNSKLLCYKAKDKEIKRVDDIIKEKIKNLEYKHHSNFTREDVKLGIRGAKYYIEFNINKKDVNPDSLLNIFLYYLKPNTNNNDNLNSNILILDQSKLVEDDIYSIRIDYEIPSNQNSHAKNKGSFYIRGKFGEVFDNFIITIEKYNDFHKKEIDALMNVYEESFKINNNQKNKQNSNNNIFGIFDNFDSNNFNNFNNSNDLSNSKENLDNTPQAILKKHGVMLFEPNTNNETKNLEWNYLAGYESQKRLIEDSILLSLTHGEIYDKISQNTRVKFEVNRPKAILFEGPPGCGKTTSAKIIANQVNIPLVYLPIESIMSKFYGESESKFSEIFDACKALGKSIIFIDEIDALATSRDDGIHEATRRILSTLLRKIDGFESDSEVLFICATNRRKDLDPALISRLDITVTFNLPDERSRGLIFQKYAKQLDQSLLEKLASISKGFSGRDISDVCKDAERRWASKYIRKETDNIIPEFEIYEKCLLERKNYMIDIDKKYNMH